MEIDRRIHERYPVELDGRIVASGHEVKVLNLSQNGALLLADGEFCLWDSLLISVDFGGFGEKLLTLNVVWSEGNVSGVSFVGLNYQDELFLKEYFEQLEGSGIEAGCF